MLSHPKSYILWAISAFITLYFVSLTMMNLSTYRSNELSQLIESDVAELQLQPQLKQYWENLKDIKLVNADSISQVWTKFIHLNAIKKNGTRYKLELLFISQNDETLKAIVQFHFIDLTTGDSVEEFARYYDLKAFYD